MPIYRRPEHGAAIGARILIARVAAGLSRSNLAGQLDLSWQQLARYEAGQSRLPAVMLDDLGRILGRPPLFFLQNDEPAIARAALLQRPEHGRRAIAFDRAIDLLRAADAAGERQAMPGGAHAP